MWTRMGAGQQLSGTSANQKPGRVLGEPLQPVGRTGQSCGGAPGGQLVEGGGGHFTTELPPPAWRMLGWGFSSSAAAPKHSFPAAEGATQLQHGLRGARAHRGVHGYRETSPVTTSASFPLAAPTVTGRSPPCRSRVHSPGQRLRWSRGSATERTNLPIARAKKRKTSGGTRRDPTRQAAGLRRGHFRPEVFSK
ncbi:hypothetical protein FQA47_006158 [Oryzias melastigma]|uniref:Uncharacterized protein n=1 Tax=Oryzias melastigma TaxID=30732 RepID=A0A834C3Q2_ORYME|nr:hypothetical protein FQA47_006158 [Oryzias melastigma]